VRQDGMEAMYVKHISGFSTLNKVGGEDCREGRVHLPLNGEECWQEWVMPYAWERWGVGLGRF